jgi:hypothetical protein
VEAPVPAAVEEPITDSFFNWPPAEKKIIISKKELQVIFIIKNSYQRRAYYQGFGRGGN